MCTIKALIAITIASVFTASAVSALNVLDGKTADESFLSNYIFTSEMRFEKRSQKTDSALNISEREMHHFLMENKETAYTERSINLTNELLNYSSAHGNRYGHSLVVKNSVFEKNRRSLSYDLDIPPTISGIATVGAAFLTNMVVHEFGHKTVADYVGAKGSTLNFFEKQGGQFFFGMSYVDTIDKESVLPYTMGGEVAADLVFEHALHGYRQKPTLYNKSLLFFSGMDFLLYSFYAYYLTDGHSGFDPTTVHEETGISKDMIFSVVLAKTAINAYRVYSGEDTIVPYFTVDNHAAMLNISIPFDISVCAFGNCNRSDLHEIDNMNESDIMDYVSAQ